MNYFEKSVPYIGTLGCGRSGLPSVYINKRNALQFAIKSQEEKSYKIQEISSFPKYIVNAVLDEDEHLENAIRVQNATEFLKDKLFVFYGESRNGNGYYAWNVYVTKQPKYYNKLEPFARIPVVVGEKEGINIKELTGDGFGHSFILRQEGKQLYAIGPISSCDDADGKEWITNGAASREICIENAFDKIVYDTTINSSFAYVPISVCRLLEEILENPENTEDRRYVNISENAEKETDDIARFVLDRKVQYIGSLDYDKSNHPCIYINKMNNIQFSIKSQEESSFHVKRISSFSNRILNVMLEEKEYLADEERIQNTEEYLKDKLFVFFSKPQNGKGNSAWDVSVIKQPKYYSAKEPFARIPVFAGKDAEEEKVWLEARVKRGERAENFYREYADFSEWKEFVNKGEPLGRIYGRAKSNLEHSFVLWREGKKLYAIGPVNKYDNNRGWIIEGNTNRVICIGDAIDRIVYDVEINPTLAFVPLSVCRHLEEMLESMEDSEEILKLNLTKSMAEKSANDKSYTLENGVQYIGALNYDRNEQPGIYINKINALQIVLKSQEENSIHINQISAFPDRFINMAPEAEKEHPDNEERIREAAEKLKDKLFVFHGGSRTGGGFFAWDVYVTEQPKYYNQKDFFAMIPVFAGKDDDEEKVWREESEKKGIGVWDFHREYSNFGEWKERINNREHLGKIYGRIANSLYHPFVLWREGKKIYAVGPISKCYYSEGWILEGNTNRVICIEDAFDRIVYDTEINPTLAYVPLSVCHLLEETLENRKDSEEIFRMNLTETMAEKELARCIDIPVFAGKNDPVEEEWGRKREERGEKQWQFGRGYENFSEWKDYVKNGKGIGTTYDCGSQTYSRSFVLWREAGHLYVVGPVENNRQVSSWQLKGSAIFKIPLEKFTDTVVYDAEENPTVAHLPVSECRMIEEKLEELEKEEEKNPQVDIPVFAGKNESEEDEWNKKREERGAKRLNFGRGYTDYFEWETRVREEKSLGNIYCCAFQSYNRSFVLWREAGHLYAVGPVENSKQGTQWNFKAASIYKIRLEELTNSVAYDMEENPTLARLPLSECRHIEEKLKEMKAREEEQYVDFPVFAGKDEPIEEEWNRKREEQGEKRRQFSRSYENFSEWKDYIKIRKGIGETYNCPPEKHKHTFVLWREEGELYAVGPVKNLSKSGTWKLAGGFLQKVLLRKFTDKVIYDTEENPSLAQLPLSECAYIEKTLERMKAKEKEENAEAINSMEDAQEDDKNVLEKAIRYIGTLDDSRSDTFSFYINKLNQLQISIKSQEEHSFFVRDILVFPENILNAVIDKDKHLEDRVRIQAAAEYLQNKLFIFTIGEKDWYGDVTRSVYVTEKPKYYDKAEPFAMIPVFAGKNDIVERNFNKKRIEKGIEVWDFYREYQDFGEWKEYISSGKPLGEIYGRITKDYLNHSFLLWREGNRLYAVGPIRKYSSSARGWIVEGNANRVICITDVLDKIVYDVEINSTLAYVPLSICKLLEETLEKMEDSDEILYMSITGEIVEKPEEEEEPEYYDDIPVFAGKDEPEEAEWNRKREERGEKVFFLNRGYKKFSEWKKRVSKGNDIGRISKMDFNLYFQSFVLWREAGELYAVGPVEKCKNYETEWRIKGDRIFKICLSELTDKVLYDMEENPTVARLPLSECKRIEEKLAKMKAEKPEEKTEAESQSCEKPKAAADGVRRIHTSRAWKYIKRN